MHHLHVHVECGDNTHFTLSQNKTLSRQLPEVSASYEHWAYKDKDCASLPVDVGQ